MYLWERKNQICTASLFVGVVFSIRNVTFESAALHSVKAVVENLEREKIATMNLSLQAYLWGDFFNHCTDKCFQFLKRTSSSISITKTDTRNTNWNGYSRIQVKAGHAHLVTGWSAKQVISPYQCLSEFLFNNAVTERSCKNQHVHISGVNKNQLISKLRDVFLHCYYVKETKYLFKAESSLHLFSWWDLVSASPRGAVATHTPVKPNITFGHLWYWVENFVRTWGWALNHTAVGANNSSIEMWEGL